MFCQGFPNMWALDSWDFKEGVCSMSHMFVHLYMYNAPDPKGFQMLVDSVIH